MVDGDLYILFRRQSSVDSGLVGILKRKPATFIVSHASVEPSEGGHPPTSGPTRVEE